MHLFKDDELQLFFSLRKVLHNDTGRSIDLLINGSREDDIYNYNARVFVKSLFSTIEGILYAYKKISLFHKRVNNIMLSYNENLALNEQVIDLDISSENPEINTKSLKLSIFDNIDFTFSITSKVYGSKFKINKSGKGWSSFRDFVFIRNNITHPRNISDLYMKDKMNIISNAYEWWNEQEIGIYEEIVRLT